MRLFATCIHTDLFILQVTICNKLYKKKPIYVKGEYKVLDESNGFSTTDNKTHGRLRDNFCKLMYSN